MSDVNEAYSHAVADVLYNNSFLRANIFSGAPYPALLHEAQDGIKP